MPRAFLYLFLCGFCPGAPVFAAQVAATGPQGVDGAGLKPGPTASTVAATGSRGEALSETGAKSPESGTSRRLMVPGSASSPAASTVTEDPLERAMIEIAKELRCAVCQNQPISESNSDLARDMRAIVREQLQAGKSRDEIVDYFVARYGDYVLLKPPFQRRGLLLWLGPPLLLAIVGVVAWFVIHRRAATPGAPPPAPLSPADLTRIAAARRLN